ncbi:MAG: ribosome small subunit-dependent GTPase A [Phycisphaerales bacterium]|nr:ribosome small subunit-dependent GTPase A [Phycisphaerales bacterium]
MTTPALRAIGWNSFFEDQLASIDRSSVIIARVSAHHGSEVALYGETGEFRVPVQNAETDGKVAVGDWLVLNATDRRAVRRLERRTLLSRKAAGEEAKPQILVANVDTVFIVSACNENFNLSGIERYLAMTLQAGAVPVVVLTKADLCDDAATLVEQARQLHPQLCVEVMDARRPEEAGVLSTWCGPGQSVALLGSSGVGKSTLANALGAGELTTGRIREKDGKGRHTTTWRSLHLLPTGGVLVDNPGVREFQLPACEDGVEDLFEDVVDIIAECRFSNCAHDGVPGCAVTAAIESGALDERRFANYRKLRDEQSRHARILADRRERERKASGTYKAAIARKRRRREES